MRLLLTGLLIINLCSGDSATSSSTNTASTNTPSTNTASTNTPSTNTPSTNTPSTNTVSTNTSSPPTSPSPTPKHTLTHASKAASTTPPTEKSEMVVNSTKELKYGTPVEIPVDVHPGSSYSFNITNEEDHKPTGEIQVNATMCQPREADSEPVERSESGLFDIPAEKVKEMIKTYCSDKSRVKRSSGNGKYKMYLFITGTNEKSADKNISVVGISTDAEVSGTNVTHATPPTTIPPSSPPTSPSPTSTHATTHASTAASTTPPASSFGTGWIIAIVFIVLFALTLIAAIAVFVYFYLKKRRGSINEDGDGLFKRQQFVDESPSRNLPFPKTVNNYQTPQTSSTIPAVNNYSSSQPYNYPQPSSNYPRLMHPNIQSPQPNIASPINPITPNNNLYGSRGLSRNY